MSNVSADKRKARRTLLIIFGVCIAPFILAAIAYNFFPTRERVNYGELLEPRPLPGTALEKLKGKWVLLQVDGGACDAACEKKLFNMRQTRIAQNREMDRVERVWIRLDDKTPDERIAPLVEGVHVIADPGPEFRKAFPGEAAAHIYVIDPLGNVMLRYPPDADPKKMMKDLSRLLKVSRTG
jgi:cytochrome oxidase Cu insertion factor (SCO1/SenC/PrrC family)